MSNDSVPAAVDFVHDEGEPSVHVSRSRCCDYVDRPAALFYERNKQQLLSNWEDRLAKSLIYVAVVLLLYILLVVITIIHDTYSVCGISEKRSNVSTLVLFIDKIYQDFFHFFIDCFPYS